jgi:hypothetical protein
MECNFLHLSAPHASHISLVQTVPKMVCFQTSHLPEKGDSLITYLIPIIAMSMMTLPWSPWTTFRKFSISFRIMSGLYNYNLLLGPQFLLIPSWLWDPVLPFWQWHCDSHHIIILLGKCQLMHSWIRLSSKFVLTQEMYFSWHCKIHEAFPMYLASIKYVRVLPTFTLIIHYTFHDMTLYPQNNVLCANLQMYTILVWVLNLCPLTKRTSCR